jgi:hypothetical protein
MTAGGSAFWGIHNEINRSFNFYPPFIFILRPPKDHEFFFMMRA